MVTGKDDTTKSTAYELSNPSDMMTFEAPTLEVAACVSFIMGEGKMGAFPKDRSEGNEVPIFLFGGAMDWYEETFGREFGDGLESLKPEIATALDSVWYAGFGDRELLASMLTKIPGEADRLEALAEWNDKRRTSMSNFVARAQRSAKALRNGAVEEV